MARRPIGRSAWAAAACAAAGACALTEGGESVRLGAVLPRRFEPEIVVPDAPPSQDSVGPLEDELEDDEGLDEEVDAEFEEDFDGASADSGRWSDIDCFAYSARAQAYACLDFASGADNGVDGLIDFERWKDRDRGAWHGHKSIALVGADVHMLPIASKEYDHSYDVVQHASEAEVLADVARRGYTEPVDLRREVPPGEWVRIGRTWLRFDTDYSEGSASFQQFGWLRATCEEPEGQDLSTLVVDTNEGERAVVFSADEARTLAVGFVEVDGGEGSGYYESAYVRVDACR